MPKPKTKEKLPFEIPRKRLKKSEFDIRFEPEEKEQPLRELINNGVINLDKPKGPTSHQVSAWTKEILKIKKVGHGGTLDPAVSGVLPIALGNALKAIGALLEAGKEYICVMESEKRIKEEILHEKFREFRGKIYQIPPLQSAVKRELRIRTIYYLEILEIEDKNVLFRVGCEAGTYIRNLCKDIGLSIGMKTWMADLRRTQTGCFKESESTILHDLKDAYVFYREDGNEEPLRRIIFPPSSLIQHLPKIVLKNSAVDALCHGAPLGIPGILEFDEKIKPGDLVALITKNEGAVGIARALMRSDEIVKKDKGRAAEPQRILMERGRYPRMWATNALLLKNR